MSEFYIKRGDTSPALLYTLAPDTLDLTGATVRFHMATAAGTLLVDEPAVIVTATVTPTVRYDWQAGDTATAGPMRAEFEVTYSGGAVETIPNDSFITVLISADLA